ncbi:hypothetical protein ADIAL_1014 [Alkalibacterium sp. AK22]|uniref:daptomycin-sensing surface protein LiaX n=1 Tax=Alkalibacterium sp. AK22 TaxID=1229520 RepID=UPI00044DBDB0|nr:daptomycin-sensing surface protein LiaX [Alkalibacterium sp. AK22]EXJ23577.1 hypothetical protein ADIAL_1014 [Alkalibacterium sp. AK22]
MNERERILDLIRQGIISTEEGLDLLEAVAKKEDDRMDQPEFGETEKTVESTGNQEGVTQAEREEAEQELKELVAEISEYSVALDHVNEQLGDKKEELKDKKNKHQALKEASIESEQAEKNRIIEKIHAIQKELELIKQLDEVDTTDEIVKLREEVGDLDKELRAVETASDSEDMVKAKALFEDISILEREVDELSSQRSELMKKLNQSKVKQWTLKARQAASQFEIPEDWKKEASEELSKAGEKLEAAGKEWSRVLKEKVDQASKSDLSETVRSNIENMMDHFDWKDISVKMPTLTTKEFKKEWQYEHTTATILDFKIANGKVIVRPGEGETVSFKAKGKLYGKMDEETPVASFDVRSTFTIDEDKLVCHVPNKRVYVELEVSLPKRTYDYMSFTMLNGKLDLKGVNAKDIFAKSTNGSLVFEEVSATMLEVKGSNGDITVEKAHLKDMLAGSVNGTVAFKGVTESADFSTTNGDIKATLTDSRVVRVKATTVNGNVKVALPKEKALEGKLKTTFGKVKSRLTDTEPLEKDEHTVSIRRITSERPLDLYAATTTGNILLKDTSE